MTHTACDFELSDIHKISLPPSPFPSSSLAFSLSRLSNPSVFGTNWQQHTKDTHTTEAKRKPGNRTPTTLFIEIEKELEKLKSAKKIKIGKHSQTLGGKTPMDISSEPSKTSKTLCQLVSICVDFVQTKPAKTFKDIQKHSKTTEASKHSKVSETKATKSPNINPSVEKT